MIDPFQVELQALLRKHGKKIVVSINPVFIEDEQLQEQKIQQEVARRMAENKEPKKKK